MKTYGKYSILILFSCAVIINLLFHTPASIYALSSPIFLVPFFLIIVFTKIIVITDTEIKFYSFLWFLYKRRSIGFDAFNKVSIYIKGTATFIFWKDDEIIAKWHSNIYKFEAKKLEIQLQQRGIETWRSGPDGWNYFD